MSEPFVHLHVHSEYSLLDGAIRCSELVDTAVAMGMNAVALTDHGVMYGCEEFFEKCDRGGIKALFGCEVYVDPAGIESRDGKGRNHHLDTTASTAATTTTTTAAKNTTTAAKSK